MTLTANRFVCGARSTVLRAMLFGEFMESQSKKINIMDVAPEVIQQLIQFINTDTCALFDVENPNVDRILNLYEAADKYQIMGLRYRCETVLAHSLCNDNVFDILQAAEERSCGYLINAVYDFVQQQGSLCELLQGLRSHMRSTAPPRTQHSGSLTPHSPTANSSSSSSASSSFSSASSSSSSYMCGYHKTELHGEEGRGGLRGGGGGGRKEGG
eukprot:GHVQ01042458.1.p1 GENE.GHVQ01042458.1~~GHVQ01042458.1.p1  ORF type:complete len:251 (-),score=65.58 GHVQ01042458.1:596-1237(-)